MKLNALSRSFSNIVQNPKASWLWQSGGHQWLGQPKFKRRPTQNSALPENPEKGGKHQEICVEDIKVSADSQYMYCQGCVRSQGVLRSRAKVVVAVEWLDEDQKALNTDWKQIEMHLNGTTAPLRPNALRSFVVKAPLDRRVKWVNAYAFSSGH